MFCLFENVSCLLTVWIFVADVLYFSTDEIVLKFLSIPGEMAFPAITSRLFASDTGALWRVCLGALLGGLACFLIIVVFSKPRHREAELEGAAASPASAAGDDSDEAPEIEEVEVELTDGEEKTAAPRAIAKVAQQTAPKVAPKVVSKAAPPTRQEIAPVRGAVPAAATVVLMPREGGLIDWQDPNVDWTEYEKLYGPRFVRVERQ